ncbi:hypothetical protein FRC11_000321 [Ceratobasidium sp. 423]|nr:hypothetical protein FRC11_000321 [Ceratobasidium sp. 423]
MNALYGCYLVLNRLLERGYLSIESAPHYGFILSKIQQDLSNITQFLSEWTKKKPEVQHMQHEGARPRSISLCLLRGKAELSTFFQRSSQSDDTTALTMNKEFAELQVKVNAVQNNASVAGSSDLENIEQADSYVRQITGYTQNTAYILKGQISYREAITMNQGCFFDIYRGKLKDGESVAIRLVRQPFRDNKEGIRFAQVLISLLSVGACVESPFYLATYMASSIMVIVQ